MSTRDPFVLSLSKDGAHTRVVRQAHHERGLGSPFAETARRLSGLAARVLGWRPGEFWAATPTELAAVFEPASDEPAPISRAELNALMERDHG